MYRDILTRAGTVVQYVLYSLLRRQEKRSCAVAAFVGTYVPNTLYARYTHIATVKIISGVGGRKIKILAHTRARARARTYNV